jgi:hypothetical protein
MHDIINSVPYYQQHLLSYVLSHCTGHRFLEHLESAGVKGGTVLEILTNAWDGMAAKGAVHAGMFFNSNFGPQDRHHQQARKMTDKYEFLNKNTLRLTFNISLRPRNVKVKNGAEWVHKRDVCIALKQLRGNGAFTAKNQWQIWNGGSNKIPSNLEYSECGAGARAALLLASGFPAPKLRQISSPAYLSPECRIGNSFCDDEGARLRTRAKRRG